MILVSAAAARAIDARRLLCVVLLLCVGAAHAASDRVLVFAAASLATALDEIVHAFPHARPVVSYAGSSTLARHIERGAPAALFISADRQWMDYLQQRDLLLPGTRRELLGNRLVLIAPAGTATAIDIAPGMALLAALRGGRLAVAHPEHVPAGRYARQALQGLGVWSSVQPHLAAAGHVRAALALVARGEAPLGIVYATDARAEAGVRVLDRFEASLHAPIVYPMALLREGGERAAPFAEYLRGPAARRIFVRHGFTALDRSGGALRSRD